MTISGAGGVITFGTTVRDGCQLIPGLIDKNRQSGVTIPAEVLKRADQIVQ